MATVEIKRHEGIKNLPNGKSIAVDFGQDYVILNEAWYDSNGTEHTDRIVAGYCDVAPGASFRPIISDLPEVIIKDIKYALAERDAKSSGKTVFDMYPRHICAAPPSLGEDAYVALTTDLEEYDDSRDDNGE